jgi:hypothetical protein
MASKILAGLLAVAVLSVGGYTYWQYADGHGCCGTRTTTTEPSTGCPSAESIAPCCQEPSRTSCLSLSTDSPCCEDAPTKAVPEVLAIQPREVK